MAILQSTDTLEEFVGNKYSLVILAAKRARQLKEGHVPLAQDASPNFLSQALREIDEQKVQAIAPPEEEIAPAPRDVISSLVADADYLDEELDLEDSDAVDDLAALLVGADEEEEEAEAEDDLLATTEETEEAETEDADDSEEEEETTLDEADGDEDDE